ncbi:MAG: copper-binding protein [Hydrogenophaga sp.]|uniref:copper-binding protein n=1 Tax=Hydrogenophaga sp. TaxID=1904254 RepID=UPI002ABD037A|nr:copper-binding protein [Hydrogenophaga sp.]MDZ4281224.1 copper-binding protein [Hydrogenophaga sp.]
MNKHTKTAAQFLTAAALAFSLPAMAQATMDHSKMGMDHSKMGMAAAPGMTDGEIRKIDKENGKITIKHGEIKHMDMPPMSMVFNVKDKAMLDKVQVGEKIQFIVIQDAGKMVVTDIKGAK